MKPGDTSLGGFHRSFPATTAGLLARFGHTSNPDHRTVFEELCQRYWKPVYTYVRIAWAKTNDDAKDLTQAFFLWILEGDALRRFAPERGSFRHYLKMLLRRFVGHQEAAAHRIKRGGTARFVPLEDDTQGLEELLRAPEAADPNKAFDQAWFKTVMKTAIDRVRQRLVGDGREAQFLVFQLYDIEGETASYVDTAARLNLTTAQVRDNLMAVRREVRSEIRSELARATTTDAELEDEWRAFVGS